MLIAKERTIQIRYRILLAMMFAPLFGGFAASINFLSRPAFQEIRNIDIFRLITIGFCFGVAFSGGALLIRSKFRA